MKVTGIIVEYNPFHNGHLYHLKKAKEITGADYIVAVMSGNFVQRGEPACMNKWVRTQMALQAGVDVVIELPVIYATASAEKFAWGAVQLLQKTGIVDFLCFGSENGNLSLLQEIASFLYKEPSIFKEELKKNLDCGLGFPAARMKAIEYYMHKNKTNRNHYFISSSEIKDILASPNNILGIEYLKALLDLNSCITPYTFCRMAAPYHSTQLKGSIASATAIRRKIIEENFKVIKKLMPSQVYSLVEQEIKIGRAPVVYDVFSPLLQYLLRTQSPADIIKFMEIGEGLENRILTSGNQYLSISEMVEQIVTKRYTRSRIYRELLHILLQVKYEDVIQYQEQGGPQYIRILGFRKKSQEILTCLKANSSLPIVSNVKNFMEKASEIQKNMLTQEILSTDIYVLGYPNKTHSRTGYDYTIPMIIEK